MKEQLKRKINQAFIWLLLAVTVSCTTNRIKTHDMSVVLSKDGVITEIQLSNGKLIKPFNLSTDLLGCKVEGKIISRKNDDGSLEFEKSLVNDSLHTSCVLIERFTPTPNSIHCKITIKGNNKPWGTSIETKLNYPVKNGQTEIWTTWGAPQFDREKVSHSLQHILRRIGNDSAQDNHHYWIDPLVPVPFTNATYYYGTIPIYSPSKTIISQGNLISIPMVSIVEDTDNSGLTIALSPKDNIINLIMNTTEDGIITFSRLYNRISKNNVVEFSFDIISHECDWRCGLNWMKNRYPEYFTPKNPLVQQMGGTGVYSSYSMESKNVEKMKKMAFTVNWQACFDFAYMGMFLPPVKQNEEWRSFGALDGKKPVMITFAGMDNFAKKYKDNGFYILNYFNITEFGTDIKFPPLLKTMHKADAELWRDCNDILYTTFVNAILPMPEKSIEDPKYKNLQIPVPFYTWEGAIAMDCGDSVYSGFLLEQARRHVKEIPNSFGICIDRTDWLSKFNERADDGITWYDGKPVRSLITSWKSLLPKLASIMHDANKVIFANDDYDTRIDIYKDVDGLFCEGNYQAIALNLTAFLGISKPAIQWTYDAQSVSNEGGDNFLQKHLYMGVFPMCPFPYNDHSIRPTEDVDKFYLDYGPLMKLMQGRDWVLKPHVIRVKDNLAKVNIFKIKGGYSVPVVYGEQAEVEVVLYDVDGLEHGFSCKAFHPGCEKPVDVLYKKEGKTITLNVPLVRGCAMLFLESKDE